MSRNEIIRAWKDPECCNRLSKAEREQLPAHPAGLIELSDAQLSKSRKLGQVIRRWQESNMHQAAQYLITSILSQAVPRDVRFAENECSRRKTL
jgi:mersacidin/lichenicidin family type 2 lantibiotic